MLALLTLRRRPGGELGGPGNDVRLLDQVFLDPGDLECDTPQDPRVGTYLWSCGLLNLGEGTQVESRFSLAARKCRKVRSNTFSFSVEIGFAYHQAHSMNTGKVLRAG